MAILLLAIIYAAAVSLGLPDALLGAAWPIMFEEFKRIVLEKYPEATIVHPEFEPVVGCVIKRCFDEGIDIEKVRDKIREGFADFRYKI